MNQLLLGAMLGGAIVYVAIKKGKEIQEAVVTELKKRKEEMNKEEPKQEDVFGA